MKLRLARPEDLDAVRALCWAYRDLLIARSRDLPAFIEVYYPEDRYRELLKMLPALHARPDGAIFVAEDAAGQIVGCAMTRREDAARVEIKRIFVDPSARGHGVAQRLIELAMKWSKLDGYRVMILDTIAGLTEAIALYEKMGFQPSKPFYRLDPRFTQTVRFYEIAL